MNNLINKVSVPFGDTNQIYNLYLEDVCAVTCILNIY